MQIADCQLPDSDAASKVHAGDATARRGLYLCLTLGTGTGLVTSTMKLSIRTGKGRDATLSVVCVMLRLYQSSYIDTSLSAFCAVCLAFAVSSCTIPLPSWSTTHLVRFSDNCYWFWCCFCMDRHMDHYTICGNVQLAGWALAHKHTTHHTALKCECVLLAGG